MLLLIGPQHGLLLAFLGAQAFQGVGEIGAEDVEDAVDTLRIRLLALLKTGSDPVLEVGSPTLRFFDEAGAQVSVIVPQVRQVTADRLLRQLVAARVEGAVQHAGKFVLSDAVSAQPHAGDENLLVQAQASAPHEHQPGQGGGAGVLQIRQHHRRHSAHLGARAEEVRPQGAGGLAHEWVSQVDVDDPGHAPGFLVEGDWPQASRCQAGVKARQGILPGAPQLRYGEDRRVSFLAACLCQNRLIRQAQRLVHDPPTRHRRQVHPLLVIFVARR